MKKTLKKSAVMLAVSSILFSSSVCAKTTTITELNMVQKKPSMSKYEQNVIKHQNWVYKTLKDITNRYGTTTGSHEKIFSSTDPLTREEAALLLVNLMGQIEKEGVELTDSEKTDLKYVKKELNEELTVLQGRVTNLENSTVKFGFGENMKLNGGIVGGYTRILDRGINDTSASNFNLSFIDVSLEGKLSDHVDYFVEFLPDQETNNNGGSNMADYWIGSDILEDHYIKVGRTWVPIGHEGAMSPYSLPLANRGQIARNFAAYRDLGVKVSSNRKFIDYYLGLFNGNRATDSDNDDRMDYMAWVELKPFANNPEWGELMIGGGYSNGKNTYATPQYAIETVGAHIGYKYKKFGFDTEYAVADGYGVSSIDSDGFFSTLTYDINDKWQVAARYDVFDPNNKVTLDTSKEYTAGVTYLQNGSNMKYQLNYVYVDNNAMYNDSQKLIFRCQYHTY